MLFGPRRFFRGELRRRRRRENGGRSVADDGPLLLFLVESLRLILPFFVYAGATYWRANSSNEITACKRLFTRRVLKEIVKNYIILPLVPLSALLAPPLPS